MRISTSASTATHCSKPSFTITDRDRLRGTNRLHNHGLMILSLLLSEMGRTGYTILPSSSQRALWTRWTSTINDTDVHILSNAVKAYDISIYPLSLVLLICLRQSWISLRRLLVLFLCLRATIVPRFTHRLLMGRYAFLSFSSITQSIVQSILFSSMPTRTLRPSVETIAVLVLEQSSIPKRGVKFNERRGS